MSQRRMHAGYFILWNGGLNYANGDSGDAEFFPTLEEAKKEFRNRAFYGYGEFRYVNEWPNVMQLGTPNVDGTSTMWVWANTGKSAKETIEHSDPVKIIHFTVPWNPRKFVASKWELYTPKEKSDA